MGTYVPLLSVPGSRTMAAFHCGSCNAEVANDARFCGSCGGENIQMSGKVRKTNNPELDMIDAAGGLEALLDRVSKQV